MDKLTFEEHLNYRLKIYEHFIFWVMIIVYIFCCGLTMIFSWKYIPIFQSYIYNKGNDIVLSLYSEGIFSISIFFIALIVFWLILSSVFSHIPGGKKAIIWYEIIDLKIYDYNVYKMKNKRNIIFMIVILVIALLFSFVSLFVHLRINDSGIYYNKIFEFKEQYYSWNELKSVSINPKIAHGKSTNLSPEMILEFGEHKIDIWDGAGLGSPNSNTLIKILNLIRENTDIEFIIYDFTDETNDLLYNNSTKRKRDNIIDVFNYLNNR